MTRDANDNNRDARSNEDVNASSSGLVLLLVVRLASELKSN